ncbi:TIGR02117 family protein [Rubinisphaera sp.]|uniref:TIGR02117 family protein n=1 Tax=Rubinisphaera sp. TaxID=2024857 RepID=UPI000C0CDC41|nr:TIGR02117 family protein [Rubinisphaera sp.]MBV08166.1 TIGR02117 family protein [Rubinisphaera sp.]HCS50785.1 TIGR02117 family protein [Planctomycetaceae bacterium]|tara:strand:+ start:585 stop:1313 length:729 start_codon:yes stop_codon:yes gene_type:complete
MEIPESQSIPEKQPPKKQRRIIRWLIRSLLLFLAMIGTYLLIILIGLLPANSDFEESSEGIEIFITSNGVHADVVMPIKTHIIDWRDTMVASSFPQNTDWATHVAVGWGDKGFYVETPTWADLKVSTAFRALFTPSPCCLHVVMQNQPQVGENVRAVRISEAQYQKMVETIQACFLQEKESHVHISGSSYGRYDTFFEAHGNYHCLNTCNSWVGWVMRESGIKTPRLTPLPKSVFLYLPATE